MKIQTIRLKNYKVFKELTLEELPRLAIFVGENGVGKSTLFDIFGFLHDALKNNIKQALAKRGGFGEVISRNASGQIEIELQFYLEIVGKQRLITYHLAIGEENKQPYIAREILRYKRSSFGSPYHFLDFKKGQGVAIVNEEDFSKPDSELDKEPQKLDSTATLAIKGLGQFERFKAASAFRNFIENWHVSDFHISEARPSRDAGYAEHLSPAGENLPLVAQYMYENHRQVFNEVLAKMAERVPGVAKVEATSTEDGRIVLRFQDGSFKDPFVARYVSDGTIKMFAYLILLNDPAAHPLLCIEEPENQLYPMLLESLSEEFRAYANRGGQVFVSSHSPDFLNGAKPEEVYWLTKNDGFTTVHRASEDERVVAQHQESSPLGNLWRQNYLGKYPA